MNEERILLAHGSGGKLSHDLIENIFLKAFYNPILSPLSDQAVFASPAGRLAMTTDSYVVNPIFFPGGDIGKLAVCGTVNDLAVGGAMPLYMSVSFIIEEGMPVEDLKKIVRSMADAAKSCGVTIVTGDTKVVEKGKGDNIFINTTGVGVVKDGINLSPSFIRPGDAVIVSGTIGDHGMAILKERGGFDIPVVSDCAPLHELVRDILSTDAGIRAMRDPTRGGLATILNEFADSSGHGILIEEEKIPVKEAVKGACELLGFDPLYLANEGKIVVVTSKDSSERVLDAMRKNPLGNNAAVIGSVIGGSILECSVTGGGVNSPARPRVLLTTAFGNTRVVEKLTGEQLPRIC